MGWMLVFLHPWPFNLSSTFAPWTEGGGGEREGIGRDFAALRGRRRPAAMYRKVVGVRRHPSRHYQHLRHRSRPTAACVAEPKKLPLSSSSAVPCLTTDHREVPERNNISCL